MMSHRAQPTQHTTTDKPNVPHTHTRRAAPANAGTHARSLRPPSGRSSVSREEYPAVHAARKSHRSPRKARLRPHHRPTLIHPGDRAGSVVAPHIPPTCRACLGHRHPASYHPGDRQGTLSACTTHTQDNRHRHASATSVPCQRPLRDLCGDCRPNAAPGSVAARPRRAAKSRGAARRTRHPGITSAHSRASAPALLSALLSGAHPGAMRRAAVRSAAPVVPLFPAAALSGRSAGNPGHKSRP